MQLFKFFRTENTSKQQKMVAFGIAYSANASEAVQKRRLAQGHCWSYANSLNN